MSHEQPVPDLRVAAGKMPDGRVRVDFGGGEVRECFPQRVDGGGWLVMRDQQPHWLKSVRVSGDGAHTFVPGASSERSYPGRHTKEEWDVIAEASFRSAAHLPTD